MSMELRDLPIEDIAPCEFLPRRDSAVGDLADAIATRGQRTPIKVAAVPAIWNGRARHFTIIEGERRWLACRQLNLPAIASEIRTADPKWAALGAVSDRFNELGLMDAAIALNKLKDAFGLDQSDIAAEIGVNRVKVAKILSVIRMPLSLTAWIREGRLGIKHIEQLLRLPTADMAKVGDTAAVEKWSVRRLEEYITRLLSGVGPLDRDDPNIQLLERVVGEQLCTTVRFIAPKPHEKKVGQMIIEYYDNDTLEGILDRCGLQV